MNILNNSSIIVVGGLNTDIVALGVKRLLKSGERTSAKELHIGPGGKSRNIAQMIAAIVGRRKVMMVGKTSKDPYGLWRPPITALKQAGVNTDYVKIVSFKESGQFPGIALIPVDTSGKNQIYVASGITDEFGPEDIDNADEIFEIAAKNNGFLVLALEFPLKTAMHAIKKANRLGINVLIDPGGAEEDEDYSELLKQKIFLLKPNEHEAKILTGIEVQDGETAKQAASHLLKQGVENVFVTLGDKGGYLFNKDLSEHIPVPSVKPSSIKDETGCGDQTMAALAAALHDEKDILTAAKIGILAGTLQFHKAGISPVTKHELDTVFVIQ